MTEKQRLVIIFIAAYNKLRGYSPSLQDIATGMGLRSRSNMHRMVHSLIEQGYLGLNRSKARTVKLLTKAKEFIEKKGKA